MRFLNNVKTRMERNKYLLNISTLLRASGLIKQIHTIEYKLKIKDYRKREKDFKKYYTIHESEFMMVLDFINETTSKKTYQALLDVLSGENYKALKKLTEYPQYFPKSIIRKEMFDANGVLIDGGAYVGDTLLEFYNSIGKYKKIYAWEPDQKNLFLLKNNIKKISNIEILEKGLWNEHSTLCFDANGTDKSKIVDNSEIKIEVDSIDNVCREDDAISFIKMDIEGSELKALEGGIKTIKRDRPILAICIYHSFDDLWRIPLFIKKLEDYELYIRAHSDMGSEVVAYGIPKERC